MAFQVTQVSDVGTSNPIVARMTIGLFEIIEMSSLPKEKADTLKKYCWDIHVALVAAEKAAKPLLEEIQKIEETLIKNGVQTQSNGNVIDTPGVINLENARVFLKYAKQALQILAKAMGFLLEKDFNGPHFNKIRDHALVALGAEHIITKLLQEDHEWIVDINTLRNEDEHPKSGKDFLSGYHITKQPDGKFLVNVPRFFNDTPIQNRLEVYSHNLLTFSEEMVAHLVKDHFPPQVTIYDIPEEQRSAEMPKRYRIGFKESFRP